MGNVYPMHTPSLAPQMPACIILTPDFAGQLQAFNALCRDLHAAGVKISAMNLEHATITIDAGSVGQLREHFMSELRGVMSRTEGSLSRIRTKLRGIDLMWFQPVREQR